MTDSTAPQRSQNLKIWDQVRTPNQAALSAYDPKAQDDLTAINPYWTYEKVTEVFGPLGFGWGYEEHETVINDGQPFKSTDGSTQFEKIISKRISFWYMRDSQKSQPISNWGSAFLVAERNGQPKTFREAHTSAITSALSKILSMLGFNADVYQGKVSHNSSLATASSARPVETSRPATATTADNNKGAGGTAATAPAPAPRPPVSGSGAPVRHRVTSASANPTAAGGGTGAGTNGGKDGWGHPIPNTHAGWVNYNSDRSAQLRDIRSIDQHTDFVNRIAPALAALRRFNAEWAAEMNERIDAARPVHPAAAAANHQHDLQHAPA